MHVDPKHGRCRECGGSLDIVDADDATMTVDQTTLPVGSKLIYRAAAGDPTVGVIPSGSGQIIIMGWDWFNAKPKGSGGSEES